MIKKTWLTAEGTVNYAARCVLPVVQTFEKPIHAVDNLACKTLDKVEETLPVVTKTPEEVIQLEFMLSSNIHTIIKFVLQIMANTRSYVNDKLQPVQAGVSSAVNIVSGTTNMLLNNRLGRLTLNSAEFTVATVHDYIDYLIPPIAGDTVTDSNAYPNLI